MTKTCSHCGKAKRLCKSNFSWVPSRGGWDSWCRACKAQASRNARAKMVEADRKRRAGLPLTAQDEAWCGRFDSQRESQRQYMERRRADPDLRAQDRMRTREFQRKARADPIEHERIKERARMGYRDRVGGERKLPPAARFRHYRTTLTPEERLDPAPLAAWLRETFPNIPVPTLADILHTPERDLRSWLEVHDRETVALPVVDRLFVSIGRPDLLNALYPLEAAS